MSCWHETDSVLSWSSLALLVSDRLRPADRATGSPYVTFLAKQLPAGLAGVKRRRHRVSAPHQAHFSGGCQGLAITAEPMTSEGIESQ
jgi:hypothetical protein